MPSGATLNFKPASGLRVSAYAAQQHPAGHCRGLPSHEVSIYTEAMNMMQGMDPNATPMLSQALVPVAGDMGAQARASGIGVFYDALISTGLAHTIACDNANGIVFTCFAPSDSAMSTVSLTAAQR